jgi:hypothetical protein
MISKAASFRESPNSPKSPNSPNSPGFSHDPEMIAYLEGQFGELDKKIETLVSPLSVVFLLTAI